MQFGVPLITLGVINGARDVELERTKLSKDGLCKFPTHCSLWHPIDILGGIFTERDTIVFDNLSLSEPAQIDYNTRVGLGSNISVRECIAMNLNMPWCVRFVRDQNLRLWILEGNWQGVFRMLLSVRINLIFEFWIFGDRINEFLGEHNLEVCTISIECERCPNSDLLDKRPGIVRSSSGQEVLGGYCYSKGAEACRWNHRRQHMPVLNVRCILSKRASRGILWQ